MQEFQIAAFVMELLKHYENPSTRQQADLLKHTYTNSYVPYSNWTNALYALQQKSNRPNFTLELAQQIELSELGLLAYLAKTAFNLEESLQLIITHSQLLLKGSKPTLMTEGSRTIIEWGSVYAIDEKIQLSDELFIIMVIILSRIMSNLAHLSPLLICFRGKLSGEKAVYERFLGCRILEKQPSLKAFLDSQLLEKPIVSADPFLKQILNQHAHHLLADQSSQGIHFLEELTLIIEQKLPSGYIDAVSISQHFNLSLRTFQRKLHALGVQYSDLLQQVRQKKAQEYMTQGHYSGSEIAYLLGYSEQSAFVRAYKAWHGISPTQHIQKESSTLN